MTEEEFREQLNEQMLRVAMDIGNDGLANGVDLDTGHENYVVELDGRLYGFGYMGELGEWVFEEIDGQVVMAGGGKELHDRVKAMTPYREW